MPTVVYTFVFSGDNRRAASAGTAARWLRGSGAASVRLAAPVAAGARGREVTGRRPSL